MSGLGTEHLVQIALYPCPCCCSHQEFPGLPALAGSAPDFSSFLDVKEAARGVMVCGGPMCSNAGLKAVRQTRDS